MSNAINPEHYNRLNPQPKDVIRAWGLNFNLGSAVKYISRAGHKDDIVQDLKKAQEFIQFEIDAIEGARAERKDKPKHEDFMDAMLRGLFGGSVGHIEITGKRNGKTDEEIAEIVRHRVASYAQESTRYCNYSKGNVGDVTFIRPCFFTENSVEMDNWVDSCMKAEQLYKDFILIGRTPQEARSILPNSLKTEVVMTANLREWRHFLSLRACGSTGKPHPQMLEVAVPLLKELRERVPVVFDDLEPMELETVK